jgi:hypothetical protein
MIRLKRHTLSEPRGASISRYNHYRLGVNSRVVSRCLSMNKNTGNNDTLRFKGIVFTSNRSIV